MIDTVKTFRRPTYSWGQHLIELAVTVFLVGLITNTVMYSILRQHGLPKHARRVINNVTTGIIASSVLLLNARKHTRRGESAVILSADGLSLRDKSGMRRIPFHDIAHVSVVPEGLDAKCVLHLARDSDEATLADPPRSASPEQLGGELALPVDVACFSASRQALEATIVSQLADEFARLLDSGATVHFSEERSRAGKHMLQAIIGFATGVVGALLLNGAVYGWLQCSRAVAHFRRGWRGRAVNFYVDREGVWLPPFTPWDHHSWDDLVAVRNDSAGLSLTFGDGVALSMSPFAEHYWPFAVWIERRFAAARGAAVTTQPLAFQS